MRSRYSFFHRLLDLIAPSACFCCGRRLAQQERFICVACQRHLPYTNHHLTPDDNEMVRLLWLRIPVNNAAALYRHMPHAQSARIIYDIKYHHQPELARYMGQLMAQTFLHNSFFSSVTAIVPIPLTQQRQRTRGYNQSLLIAEGIAQVTQLPLQPTWIERTAFSKSQTHLSHAERAENVEDAFCSNTHDDLTKQHILLVDDVITTGATICAAAKALMRAGATRFSVATLCFAKV